MRFTVNARRPGGCPIELARSGLKRPAMVALRDYSVLEQFRSDRWIIEVYDTARGNDQKPIAAAEPGRAIPHREVIEPGNVAGTEALLNVNVRHIHPRTQETLLDEWSNTSNRLDLEVHTYVGAQSLLVYCPQQPIPGSDDDGELSDDLVAVFGKARELSCRYVLVDVDGLIHEDLPRQRRPQR